jgi:hypothetical protein
MNKPEAGLTPEERAHVIRLLRDSQEEFLELISGLTGEQWIWRAAQGRWSVAQIAEHLVLGERSMLAKIAEALASPPSPGWEEQDARMTKFLGRVLTDRSQKATAPAPLDPHHHWTREQTIARYKTGRAKTLQFVEQVDQPMKDRLAAHPFPVFNMLSAYHWLLYIPLHNQRHSQQIAESLKEALVAIVP